MMRGWLALALIVVSLGLTRQAEAGRFLFRAYGESEGLGDVDGRCFTQTPAGYVLVCSDAGLLAYDGRRFETLGPAQGLMSGGVVEEITLAANGRVAVRTPNQLFISDQAVTLDRPPNALRFRSVDLHDPAMFDRLPHRIARWGDGFAVASGRRIMQISLSAGPAVLTPFAMPGDSALDSPENLFSVRGRLWETFSDGRLCAASPSKVRCYGPGEGLAHGPYEDVEAGPDASVIARSSRFLATIDISGSASEQRLPFQGGRYDNFLGVLRVARMPAGELVTQSANGLIVRRSDGWHELQAADGIPEGLISSMLVDADGQLWIQVVGNGLYRGIGIGHWEAFQHDSGLSKGTAWQTVGSAKRSLWVSTDTGINELRDLGGAIQVVKTLPGPSFALAADSDGHVWSSLDAAGALEIEPSTGAVSSYKAPDVTRIAAGQTRIWLGTRTGLYVLNRSAKPGTAAIADAACGRVNGLAADGSDGAWMLCNGRLWRRHARGPTVRVGGLWPSREFSPFDVWPTGDGRLWLAGAGGLYDVRVAADMIVSIAAVSIEDLRTTDVYAVMVDHRGWVWAGTDRGVTVFNGQRWVSSDATTGLLWNDLSESGLHEDEDGSVWIGTDKGLSHMLDPSSLFVERRSRVVISDASLGDTIIGSGWHSYTIAPLSLQFGVLSFASEESVVFRYRLSGVDQGWVESVSGTTRYPSVPPGHHVLTVVGYDPLTQTTSKPASMTIDIGYPWWRQWWAEALYGALVLTAVCGLLKVRDTVTERKQRAKQLELQALVEERTREMELAQAELRRQLMLDGLTGLLNRREVQARVAARLESVDVLDALQLMVAMIDIDHFKHINDRHGHLAGDDVLREMSARITRLLREGDYAGRYGGEEILVVFDDRDSAGVERAKRLHQAIRIEPFDISDTVIQVTCSIGVARARRGDSWTSLVGRADAALYDAKHLGRDCVVDSTDDPRRDPTERAVRTVPAMPLSVGGRLDVVLPVPEPGMART